MEEIKITDYAMYEKEGSDLEIVSGNFFEGEMVTVKVCGKEFTRKVKYSARKYADLYITINGYAITYEEFYDKESFRDCDYSRIAG